MITATAAPVLAHATAREALEHVLGHALPSSAVFRVRPLLAVAAAHHVDGPDAYEAEQVAGAVGDAHLAASTSQTRRVLTAAAIVRHPHLAGDLAIAARRPDTSLALAVAWTAA